MITGEELFRIIKRDAVSIYSPDSLREKFTSGRQLKVKFGADPSAPDLHLGHSVPLRKFRLMQDAGHKIVFIIGDFTAMIGDPSGKSKARVPLSFERTRENSRSYFEQVTKILDPELTEITYNSEWLGKMNFSDVLSLASKYTLARMLERDDFSKRYSSNQPISMHELLYPLMQGYDSVAIKADIEVGGTDQTFNLLVGRDLQRDYAQPAQEVITFPLLIGLDGDEKMSKSLGNYIGINEDASSMFEKCMRVPDTLLPDYFRLTTDIFPEALIKDNIREAHLLYSRTICNMYCGASAAAEAEERYHAIASGQAPGALTELRLPQSSYKLWKLVLLSGLSVSGAEARRLIEGGGISVDGVRASDPELEREFSGSLTLKRGKSQFVRLIFES